MAVTIVELKEAADAAVERQSVDKVAYGIRHGIYLDGLPASQGSWKV
jgi:hypothetical protein